MGRETEFFSLHAEIETLRKENVSLIREISAIKVAVRGLWENSGGEAKRQRDAWARVWLLVLPLVCPACQEVPMPTGDEKTCRNCGMQF